MYLLAHDLGTSGDKATLFHEDGTLLKSVVADYPTYYGIHGEAEQEPQELWAAVCQATRQVTADISPKEIAAVAFTGTQNGCICLDKDGNPLRRAIIWADVRAAKQADEFAAAYGGVEACHQRTGKRPSASFSLAKLMWVRENERELYAKTACILQTKDYIVYRLTGRLATDYSDASSTQAYDIANRCWAEDVIRAAGLDMEKFPEICEGAAVIGHCTQSASQETGLAEGTPIVLGAGDGTTCNLGAGGQKEGAVTINLGTSAFLAYTTREPVSDVRLSSWNTIERDLLIITGTMQSFGGAISWMKNNLCRLEKQQAAQTGEDVFSLINGEIMQSPPGANGLLFLPYLQGEREPHWDANARGVFLGLTMQHSHRDMMRAVFEGVALNMGLIYQIFKANYSMPDSIIIGGGGANSPLIQQILADVLQAEILVPDITGEIGSYGAAVAAGYAVGIYPDLLQARRFIKIGKRVEPIAENAKRYENIIGVFGESYQALKPIFPKLSLA